MDGWVQDAVQVVGALGGLTGLGAGVHAVVSRRKIKADAADVLTDAAVELVKPLKERVAELEAEVRSLRAAWNRLRAAIYAPSATVERLRELAVEPDPLNGRHPG